MRVKKVESNPDTKVIIVGDLSVGKTSIITQFDKHTFSANPESTVGANFVSREVESSRGPVTLLLWDTAGQERFRSLIPMYSRNAAAALLVVNSASAQGLDSLSEWHSVLTQNCPKSCRIYVIANKIDLECRIRMDELRKWAESHEYPLFESSAMSYESVEPIFKRVAEDLSVSVRRETEQAVSLAVAEQEQPHTTCC